MHVKSICSWNGCLCTVYNLIKPKRTQGSSLEAEIEKVAGNLTKAEKSTKPEDYF